VDPTNPLNFIGLSGFPVVVGIVQVLKAQVIPDASDGVKALVALGVAEAWGVGVAVAAHASVPIAGLTGVIVWLMAMGAWSGGRSILGK
jgi:hypothetical protein